MVVNENLIIKGYEYAKEVFKAKGVDVDAAMEICANVAISLHCWQGDDVCGFEGSGGASGGIATTGNYPGKAVTANQLRDDLDVAMSLIPGKKKLNLHASYAELDGKSVERSELTVEHFAGWLDYAKKRGIGLDFNPTYFSHPLAADGFTLSNTDESIRNYWIEHGKRCREIALAFATELGKPCVLNFWMPDGYKDVPIDQAAPRKRMIDSLDAIFAEPIDTTLVKEAVESKLFGLGVESYTVGSHELMMTYAVTRKKLYCLDAGHFHPTEVISGKISSCMQYMDELLLHVSRGVRWDSDHVVAYDDELQNIMREIVRGGYLNKVNIALDFFDASINRIAAWAIGTRNAQRAMLSALLEPTDMLKQVEASGDYTTRLALLEETKADPSTCIWDYYCLKQGVPTRDSWLDVVKTYEKDVLLKR